MIVPPFLTQREGAIVAPSGRSTKSHPPLRQRTLCIRQDVLAPTLVALHGISRDHRAIWKGFKTSARENYCNLVVPHFSVDHWPRFQQIGSSRPDLALLSSLDRAEAEDGLPTRKFALFGYSGGAQLAHRFAMLYPHRVASLHVAAAGWYCLPDETVQWPEGLARNSAKTTNRIAELKRRQLQAFLRLPVRLYVGSEDLMREPSLRQNRSLDFQQGSTRLARAENYVRAFQTAAARHGIEPNITMTILPDCQHDFTECAKTADLTGKVIFNLLQLHIKG